MLEVRINDVFREGQIVLSAFVAQMLAITTNDLLAHSWYNAIKIIDSDSLETWNI